MKKLQMPEIPEIQRSERGREVLYGTWKHLSWKTGKSFDF